MRRLRKEANVSRCENIHAFALETSSALRQVAIPSLDHASLMKMEMRNGCKVTLNIWLNSQDFTKLVEATSETCQGESGGAEAGAAEDKETHSAQGRIDTCQGSCLSTEGLKEDLREKRCRL